MRCGSQLQHEPFYADCFYDGLCTVLAERRSEMKHRQRQRQ